MGNFRAKLKLYATVAAMAIDQSVTVQNVSYEDLKKKLIIDGQILE